jgi:hypothetical protein
MALNELIQRNLSAATRKALEFKSYSQARDTLPNKKFISLCKSLGADLPAWERGELKIPPAFRPKST